MDGGAVGAHAGLGKASDLRGQCLCRQARLPIRYHTFAGADAQGLVGAHLAPGEDEVERTPLSDQAGQSHSATVQQGNAPSPAVNAELGAFLHHADVAPQGQFEPARDRRSGDRGR
jgi:hypothetical protein